LALPNFPLKLAQGGALAGPDPRPPKRLHRRWIRA